MLLLLLLGDGPKSSQDLLFGVSGSFEGIDPSLEIPRGKSDDYPRLFTLNNAKILVFAPAHNPYEHHIWKGGAWGSNPLKHLGGPKVFDVFDGFNLAEQGFGSWPAGSQLFQGAQLQP